MRVDTTATREKMGTFGEALLVSLFLAFLDRSAGQQEVRPRPMACLGLSFAVGYYAETDTDIEGIFFHGKVLRILQQYLIIYYIIYYI